MALNFPASPTEGQTYAAEGATYIYHNGRWVVLSNVDMSAYVAKAGDTMTGILTLDSVSPSLRFRENDQPAGGNYRFIASADHFYMQRTTLADWSNAVNVWRCLATGEFEVYKPTNFTDTVTIENTTPALRFHESDAVEPKGRWQLQAGASGGALGVYNATATDWSANTTYMQFQASGYNSVLYDRIYFGVPFSNSIEIRGTSPALYFLETDAVSPAGQFLFTGYGAGNFAMQYCAAADWGSPQYIWSYTAGVFAITNMAAIGSININRDKGGSQTVGRIATNAAGGISLQSFDSSSFVFTYLNTTLTGRFDAAGVTAPVQTYSVVTKEKGDARYTAISSRRYKDDISTQPLNKLVHAFDHLVPHTWVWGGDLPDGDERAGTTGLGFIAEEVEDVLPAAVVYRYDTMSPALLENGEDDPDSPTIDITKKHVDALDHGALIAVLYAKIKQLEARLETVEGIV